MISKPLGDRFFIGTVLLPRLAVGCSHFGFGSGLSGSAPGVTRTPGQRFRKPLLYPPELRGRITAEDPVFSAIGHESTSGGHYSVPSVRSRTGVVRTRPRLEGDRELLR